MRFSVHLGQHGKFHLEVKIMSVFIYCKNVKGFQIQKIQGHLSQRVLPKEFLVMQVKAVTSERRLLRVYSTRYRDFRPVCWSVKILYKFHAPSRIAQKTLRPEQVERSLSF